VLDPWLIVFFSPDPAACRCKWEGLEETRACKELFRQRMKNVVVPGHSYSTHPPPPVAHTTTH